MTKIIGVILIISSASMYGFKMSGELKIHCDELLEIKKIIMTIAEQNVGTFSENWKNEWEKGFKTLLLTEEEQKDIINLIEGMGLRDKDSQIKQLDLYLSKLDMSIDGLKEVYPKKSRIYKCLSVGFGIFLTLIIV